MTMKEADKKSANLTGDMFNCQSCVVVYEARRRGINITALKYNPNPKSASYRLGANSGLAFKDSNEQMPMCIKINEKNKNKTKAQLLKKLENIGRYHVGANKGKKGHIFVAERLNNDTLLFIDPQDGSTYSIGNILLQYDDFEILKVDELRFNRAILKEISEKVW